MRPRSIGIDAQPSAWRRARLPVAILAAGVSAFIVFGGGKPATRAQAKATLTSLSAKPAPMRMARSATPPPAALQQTLDKLVADYGEPVGVAVTDVDKGWVAAVDGNSLYPQQSVSKLWVAVTALNAVDRGQLSLDRGVMLGPQDRSVFFQPIVANIGPTGYATTIRDLMQRALIQSDNAANDKLMREAGGSIAVMATLKDKGIEDIRLGTDERRLQAHTAGLVWTPALGEAGAFETARAHLPKAQRDAAMQAYLDNPLDGATPIATVEALSAIKRGEVLSPASTTFLLDTMAQARTGPHRLKGGLPADWSIAHKTGTGQDWRGASMGINDVGLLTAPDGKTYAVAVFMRRTHQPVPARLAFMQAVSRAVVDTWRGDAPSSQMAALDPNATE
jgi:beta-lactamase class A